MTSLTITHKCKQPAAVHSARVVIKSSILYRRKRDNAVPQLFVAATFKSGCHSAIHYMTRNQLFTVEHPQHWLAKTTLKHNQVNICCFLRYCIQLLLWLSNLAFYPDKKENLQMSPIYNNIVRIHRGSYLKMCFYCFLQTFLMTLPHVSSVHPPGAIPCSN